MSSSCPKAQNSDVELSAESDTVLQPDGEPAEEEVDTAGQDAAKEEPVQEQDLQAQVCVQHKSTVERTCVSARSTAALKLQGQAVPDDYILELLYASIWIVFFRLGNAITTPN